MTSAKSSDIYEHIVGGGGRPSNESERPANGKQRESKRDCPLNHVEVCENALKLLLSSNYSHTAKQQGAYLLSQLPKDGRPRPLSSQILKDLLPSVRQLHKLLIPDVITVGESYSTANKKCKPWAYTTVPAKFVPYELTNAKLLSRLKDWKQDRQNRVDAMLHHHEGSQVGIDWMRESYSRVSYSSFALELMAKDEIKPPQHLFNPSNGVRVTHTFTGLPSKVRLNLLIDGQYVADVDMSKSQIAILAAKWTCSQEERERLQGYILDGTVYSRLNDVFKKDEPNITRWNQRHPDAPVTTPKKLLNKILMGHPKCDWHTRKLMKSEFPSLIKSIDAYKWKAGADALSKFAVKLQTEEAIIVSFVAEKCADQQIYCLPIYDGMLVPERSAKVVLGFFREVLLDRLGFAPDASIETAGDEVFPDICAA